MKIQDIFFLLLLAFLILRRNLKYAVFSGLICLILSIPLFATWIFFSAERLTWYASTFFLLAILIEVIRIKKNSV